MDAMTVGTKLVELVNQGREGEAEFVRDYYSDDVVSIEGQGSEEMPARIEGIDAIHAKHAWWYDNNEVHSTVAEGPYIGHRDDQFVIRFVMDLTSNGERGQMNEVGLFTVKEGKIAQEEYLYLIG